MRDDSTRWAPWPGLAAAWPSSSSRRRGRWGREQGVQSAGYTGIRDTCRLLHVYSVLSAHRVHRVMRTEPRTDRLVSPSTSPSASEGYAFEVPGNTEHRLLLTHSYMLDSLPLERGACFRGLSPSTSSKSGT